MRDVEDRSEPYNYSFPVPDREDLWENRTALTPIRKWVFVEVSG